MEELKKVDLNVLREAVKEFNQSKVWQGILDKKLNPIQRFDVLKQRFMEAVELIPEEKEDELPDIVVEVYNALVDMEEIENEKTKQVNEKSEVSDTKDSKNEDKKSGEKKMKFRKGSRPHMLYEKANSGLTLNELLEDKELLEKYKNHKSWIKSDYKRIFAEE